MLETCGAGKAIKTESGCQKLTEQGYRLLMVPGSFGGGRGRDKVFSN